jgi:hypothetical protein
MGGRELAALLRADTGLSMKTGGVQCRCLANVFAETLARAGTIAAEADLNRLGSRHSAR